MRGISRLRRHRAVYVIAQVAFAALFYWAYAAVRDLHGAGFAKLGVIATARQNGLAVLHLERPLRLDIELGAEAFALRHHTLVRLLDGFYGSAHFIVTLSIFVWLLARCPRPTFVRWRNVLALTTILAIATFALYPCMPPRLLPAHFGYVDTLSRIGGLWSYNNGVIEHITDPYAAMPSLHCGWATWCATVVAALVRGEHASRRRIALSRLAYVYPAITATTVVLTGNHWLIDVFAGVALVPVSVAVTSAQVRARVSGLLHRATPQRLAHEVIVFALIGGVNTLLDIAVFNLVRAGLHADPITAKAVSTAVAGTSAFLMNRHWTWRSRPRTGFAREYTLFVVVSVVGLGIAELPLAISHYMLGHTSLLADNIAGNGIGLALATVWRFTATRRWVFPAVHPHPERQVVLTEPAGAALGHGRRGEVDTALDAATG